MTPLEDLELQFGSLFLGLDIEEHMPDWPPVTRHCFAGVKPSKTAAPTYYRNPVMNAGLRHGTLPVDVF